MYKNSVISTKNERLTSGFGLRPNPTGAGTEQHNGADFVDTNGLQRTQDVGIIAIADGKIVEVINGDLVGWTVAVSHENKILSRYQHMKNNSIKVKAGDIVKKGQTLGIMGTTGRSTGIHLHFGIKENSTAWNNGVWVDPLPYLTGAKIIGSTVGRDAPGAPQTISQTTPSSGQAACHPSTEGNIKVGDKVKIKDVSVGSWGKTYDGKDFRVWHEVYDVIQIIGDRVVIGLGKAVAAPVNIRILVKV